MRKETTLVVKITWDSEEVPRPGHWDWANLIDVERGHVEILADSDDLPTFRAGGVLEHGN
jgi:hypothetical protein